jgi:lipopolysaccharide transport system ATP-binding protein
MDVEVLLTDMSEVPLAFFSPGHTRGVSPVRPIGDFEIHHRIKLPDRLSAGEYAVSLALTSHNENYWARLPHAARIIVEGTSTSTGRPLEYRDGRGFIFLNQNDGSCFYNVGG